MQVTYFNPNPPGSEMNLLQSNHLEYFRCRGWVVHLLVARGTDLEPFRRDHRLIRQLTVVDPPKATSFRDALYAYSDFATAPESQAVTQCRPDLFFTYFPFTAPLLEHLPTSCKKVQVAPVFMSEHLGREVGSAARNHFFRALESKLYQMFDLNLVYAREHGKSVSALYESNVRFAPLCLSAADARAKHQQDDCDYELFSLTDGSRLECEGLLSFYQHVYQLHLQQHGVRWCIAGQRANHLGFSGRKVFINEACTDSSKSAKLTVFPVVPGASLPFAALRAMANGQAIVTTPDAVTSIPGLDEAVIVLDMQADPHAAATILRDLLASREKRLEWGAKALAYVQRHHCRQVFLDSMDQAMKSIGLTSVARAA